jgi:hypothetical protein
MARPYPLLILPTCTCMYLCEPLAVLPSPYRIVFKALPGGGGGREANLSVPSADRRVFLHRQYRSEIHQIRSVYHIFHRTDPTQHHNTHHPSPITNQPHERPLACVPTGKGGRLKSSFPPRNGGSTLKRNGVTYGPYFVDRYMARGITLKHILCGDS